MTIEQVKAEAKKRFDKELTDEQARAWLDAHPAGELQDDELADAAGGCSDKPEPVTRKPFDCCCNFEPALDPYPACRNCKYGSFCKEGDFDAELNKYARLIWCRYVNRNPVSF